MPATAQELISNYRTIRARLRGPSTCQVIPIKLTGEQHPAIVEVTQKPMERGVPARTKFVRKYPAMADIMHEVCRLYKIGSGDIRSDSRRREVAWPRFVMFYLQKTLCFKSYPEIGRWCGGRDHTSALHGVGVTVKRLEREPTLMLEIAFLKKRISDLMAEKYLPPNNGPHQ